MNTQKQKLLSSDLDLYGERGLGQYYRKNNVWWHRDIIIGPKNWTTNIVTDLNNVESWKNSVFLRQATRDDVIWITRTMLLQ